MSTDHHRYAMKFDDGHIEYVSAPGSTEAVALREGAPNSLRPHTITDLTVLHDMGRPSTGLGRRLWLTDPRTVDEDRPLFNRPKEFTGGPA